MVIIRKHDDTIEGLTPEQLKIRNESDKEANFIHKEIIYILKACLFISLIIIVVILITQII